MTRIENSGSQAIWSLTAELKEIMDVDSDMLPELVTMFLTDSAARLKTLEDASVRQDFRIITAQAHSLKGSSVQMGAARLASLCAELELSDRPTPAQCTASMQAINDEFALVRTAMEQFLINGDHSPEV